MHHVGGAEFYLIYKLIASLITMHLSLTDILELDYIQAFLLIHYYSKLTNPKKQKTSPWS